jgi:hypothetical protein
LPARELALVRRFPEHRHFAAGEWAYEIPLHAAEMARLTFQDDALMEVADLEVAPCFVRKPVIRARRVRRDKARGKDLAVVVSPPDRVCAECPSSNALRQMAV